MPDDSPIDETAVGSGQAGIQPPPTEAVHEIPSFLRKATESVSEPKKEEPLIGEIVDNKPAVVPVTSEPSAAPVPPAKDFERVDSPNGDEIPVDDSQPTSRISEFMTELNLGKRHIFMFIGCSAIFIIAVILFFSFLFSLLKNDTEEIVDVPVDTEIVEDQPSWFSKIFGGSDTNDELEPEPEPVDVVVEPIEPKVEETYAIKSTTSLGRSQATSVDSSAISKTVQFGLASVVEDKLSFYARTYRRVRNIYNTDLFNLLNVSVDRKLAYDEFVIQFKGANEQAKLAYNELLSEISEFDLRLTKLNSEVQVVEQKFFTALDNLESEVLPEHLDAFQELTTKRDILKSELKARQAVAERFKGALPLVENKIKAIELNQDAFVKGVKVVNFDAVDLDLVIREGN